LRKQDVNLGQEFLMVQLGKTKAARRRIPLTSDAKKVLQTRTKIQLASISFLVDVGARLKANR
jgi:hypothetical protein